MKKVLLVMLTALLASGLVAAQDATLTVAFFYPQEPAQPELNTWSYGIAGESGRNGARLAAEEFGWAAQQTGADLRVLFTSAPDARSAARAAERLIATEDVFALIGGFEASQAQVLGELAEEHDLLFINTGSTYRSSGLHPNTIHLQPSVDTWLKAILLLAEVQPEDSWLVIYADDAEGHYRLERAGELIFSSSDAPAQLDAGAIDPTAPLFDAALAALRQNPATAVLLLVDWQLQLDFLGQLESSGISGLQIFSLPDSVTSTREFYGMARATAPRYSSGLQLASWEATLSSPEAAELNIRYLGHYGEPMDPPAWAAYEAVKLVFEAAMAVGTDSAAALLAYLTDPQLQFSIDKDRLASLNHVDNELLQPLYTVRIMPYRAEESLLNKKLGRVELVRVIEREELSTE